MRKTTMSNRYELRAKGQPAPVTLEMWRGGRQVGTVALYATGGPDPRPGDILSLLVTAVSDGR